MAAPQPHDPEGLSYKMTQPDDSYGDDALAAEYVLGLLEQSEHDAFETRLQADRLLQQHVWEWEAHFGALAAEVEEVEPPARLRSVILSAVAPDLPGRRRLGLWASALGGLVAAAVVLLLVFGDILRQPTDLSPAFQAELTSADGTLVLVAGVIPATHEIVIDRIHGGAPVDGVRELWLIAEGSDGPVSLGLLDASGSTRIRVPDHIAPGVRGGTIAVSLEPAGGSPTGSPTGPVLGTATFSDL